MEELSKNNVDITSIIKKKRISVDDDIYRTLEAIDPDIQKGLKKILEVYNECKPLKEVIGDENVEILKRAASEKNKNSLNKVLQVFAIFDIVGKSHLLADRLDEYTKSLFNNNE